MAEAYKNTSKKATVELEEDHRSVIRIIAGKSVLTVMTRPFVFPVIRK